MSPAAAAAYRWPDAERWAYVADVVHPNDAERGAQHHVVLLRSRVTGIYTTFNGVAFRSVRQAWARAQAGEVTT